MNVSPESSQPKPESEKPEINKNEVIEKALDKELVVGGSSLEDLPKTMKWIFELNKGDEHWSVKKAESFISGLSRGLLTERISLLVEINEADTVIPKEGRLYDVLNNSEMISTHDESLPTMGIDSKNERFKEGWLRGKKPGILQMAVAKKLNIPDAIPEDLRFEYLKNVLEGYGGSQPEGENAQAGIYYEETTMPDAFIKYKDKIIGAAESKAYTPDEFKLYVKNARKERSLEVTVSTKEYNEFLGTDEKHWGDGIRLGVDAEGEKKMVGIIRDAFYNEKPFERSVPIVLRVPSDVENEDIELYHELCQELGYQNMAVQKLPFSSSELNKISKKAIKSLSDEFASAGNLKFSKRELDVIDDFIHTDDENQ